MWDEIIKTKVAEEAYLHYKRNSSKDATQNWLDAQNEIMDRIRFIAYYLHVNDLNRSPVENWVEAQKIYINNF